MLLEKQHSFLFKDSCLPGDCAQHPEWEGREESAWQRGGGERKRERSPLAGKGVDIGRSPKSQRHKPGDLDPSTQRGASEKSYPAALLPPKQIPH